MEEADEGGVGRREVGRRPRWMKAIVPVRTSIGWFCELPRNRTCDEKRREMFIRRLTLDVRYGRAKRGGARLTM